VAASLLPVRQLLERRRQVSSQCLLNSSNSKQLTHHIIRTLQMTGDSSGIIEWIMLVLLNLETKGLILSLEADYIDFFLLFSSILTGRCCNIALKYFMIWKVDSRHCMLT
jgi:hypothetical protein